jgi:hypothetical protein
VHGAVRGLRRLLIVLDNGSASDGFEVVDAVLAIPPKMFSSCMGR